MCIHTLAEYLNHLIRAVGEGLIDTIVQISAEEDVRVIGDAELPLQVP